MKSWFHNCIEVREESGGMLPLRFTEDQLGFFKERPHLFRCYNSAGVRMDLLTDSPYISLRYRVSLKSGTTEQLYFDIYVDDVMVGFKGGCFTDEGLGEWKAELPINLGQPRRVTIYFPSLASVIVEKVAFADDAIQQPVEPYHRNLLCFGDSITQGMSAVHPSQTYTILAARHLRANLLNQAISGFVFHSDMIDPELPYQPDLITVAYGTNDWALCESLEQFQSQADEFIRKLASLYQDVPIVVLSPLWRSDLEDTKPCGQFLDIHHKLEQICSLWEHVHYVDGLTLTPHHGDYFTDGLHPNDLGFLHMALQLLRQFPQEMKLDQRMTNYDKPLGGKI